MLIRSHLLNLTYTFINDINRTVIDLETTFQVLEGGKTDPSPFDPRNRIVCAGYKAVYGGHVCANKCLRFYHKKLKPYDNAKRTLQATLNKTTLLIGHNLKFDLEWLYECGFKYEGEVYDTMIADYVMAQGSIRNEFSLNECLKRHGLETKSSAIDEYKEKNISFEHIPWTILKEYNLQDVEQTDKLFLSQMEKLHAGSERTSYRFWYDGPKTSEEEDQQEGQG